MTTGTVPVSLRANTGTVPVPDYAETAPFGRAISELDTLARERAHGIHV